ncbi:hypothetical protein D3C79_874420 [compost metagenome]
MWPVRGQPRQFHRDIAQSSQAFTGQRYRSRVQVLAQQVGTTLGQQGAELAIGARRLEHALVALARQAGHDQVALALFVPAGAKGPRVFMTTPFTGTPVRKVAADTPASSAVVRAGAGHPARVG